MDGEAVMPIAFEAGAEGVCVLCIVKGTHAQSEPDRAVICVEPGD
jgi:hypothetical protein